MRAKELAKRAAITAGLEISWLADRFAAWPQARGRGVIFTLHHVRPWEDRRFAPNAILEVTPAFLEAALMRLKASGYLFVPLDAIPDLLRDEKPSAPFAAFTLDDGYRNNLTHALPVFERHGAPFTIFVAKGLTQRTHTLWWETLACLLGKANHLAFDFGQGKEAVRLDTIGEKHRAFARFVDHIQEQDEAVAVAALDGVARDHGIDPLAVVEELVMGVPELQRVAAHPLARLGAHTISHRALARLTPEDAREEMRVSADYVAEITGRRPSAIAYPYGSPRAASRREAELAAEQGFRVGVTTQPGTLHPDRSMTYLPRMSLNGLYQKTRYVSALASGIPVKLMGR